MGATHISVPDHRSPDCTFVNSVLARIGDKWAVLIVRVLGEGTLRFSELQRRIGGISQRMLTLTLRGLERDGLVARTVHPTVPPRVDYALTPLGHSLLTPVRALGDWAFANQSEIISARERFDGMTAKAGAPPKRAAARPRQPGPAAARAS